MMKQNVDEFSKEIESKTIELEKFYRGENTKLEDENKMLLSKVKSLEEHQVLLRKHIDDKEKTIKSMMGKNNGNSPVAKKHKSIQVKEDNTIHEDKLIKSFENVFDSKLRKIEETMQKLSNIESNVVSMIDSKLSENMKAIDKKLRDVITENKSYADAVKDSAQRLTQNTASSSIEGDFRSIMKETKNNELVQEQERKSRSRNIIIHGIAEISGDNKKIHDEEFIKSLLNTIEIDIKPNAIMRLGNATTKQDRPIKLIMSSELEKNSIMNNLRKLKDAEAKFKKLRITDDYTVEEREEIKKWVNKANLKNSEEGENSHHIWRVRGSPKNGLRLVKITRQ